MSDENNAAEPSLASAGSRGEPFAWAAECAPGAWSFTHMRHVASRWPQSETIPLYRQPQPTLTNEEREAIAWAINKTAQSYDDAEGGPIKREAMRGLLQRTK